MIFASDLDQTLIYSEASMGLLTPLEQTVPIELYENRYISFMTQHAINLLGEVAAKMAFIPVTTRTVVQYERIFVFKDTVKPKYAITSNGGTILVNGQIDLEWKQAVTAAVAGTSAPAEEIKSYFDEIASEEWVLTEKYADDLFYSLVVVRDNIPQPELEDFRVKIAGLGWNLSIQGRKIYLVPAALSKGAAMLHLKERLGASFVVAAGDSLLDESLLMAADEAIAPRHGELFKHYPVHPHISYTQLPGIIASVEILEKVLERHALINGYSEQYVNKEGVL
ncbi:HAD family hydrolase [Paenibacillus agricola]|uniref:Hydrolase n=1 Tax=Paenibacillus agricola TaxID=2716264 RepID=A0ABX0J6P3_9BACL|nr:HAD family hydrolase [Paenibacillus agricola]NHN29460.1 hydrolase [Paenibacillus agricola]